MKILLWRNWFIGSHFLRQALAKGHDLVCLRRPGSKTRVPLEIEQLG